MVIISIPHSRRSLNLNWRSTTSCNLMMITIKAKIFTVSHYLSLFSTVFNIFHHFPLLLTVSLRFSLFFTVIHYFSPFFTVSLRGSMCCWPCWPGRPLGPVRPWVQYERRRIRTVNFVYFAADFCSNFAMKFRNGGPNNLYK